MIEFWEYFWLLNFIVAGSAFAIIAAVVTVKGVGDLREMLRLLDQDSHRKEGK